MSTCVHCGHFQASHTEAGYLNVARPAMCWFRGRTPEERRSSKRCPCPGFESEGLW
jgi:hypothetical protein